MIAAIRRATVPTLLAIALLLAAGAYERWRTLQHRLAAATTAADTAARDVSDRDRVIAQLLASQREQAQQQQQLEAMRGKVDATLSSYQTALRKLIDENAEVRAWADARLPDAVARLHASPTLTGAADYTARMRADHPLHDSGGGTDDKRPAQ